MQIWPFQASRAARDAERLLGQVTLASRNPALFGEGRAPDTLEGRFEVLTLFATLALAKLRGTPGAETLAQEFTDRLFRSVDAGLREAAVGDLAVPKRMRKLAADFLGRASAYADALGAANVPALQAALQRNLGELEAAFAASLARRVMDLASQQASAPVDLLFAVDGWRLADE